MEKVQLNLERLLPELRDLERKKVFTKSEISDIVSKRRGHEIACAKRDVTPADYLRYIEYEARLEKLRKVRASRLQTTTKKTLSDHSIAAHITQLHRLASRRFPASIPVWEAFLAHALAGASPTLVSRTLTSAIAMHPTHVPFWIMASRWESDGDRKGMGGGNEEAARRLCMRALRFLKGTEGEKEVWQEWIRVEVLFAERMRQRWAVLGIGKLPASGEPEATGMDVDETEETGDEDVVFPEVPQDSALEAAAEKVEESAKSGQEALREGAVVRVVIDSCLKSFNFSIEAYHLLLTALRNMPSTLRLALLEPVYISLAEHHPATSPSYPSAVRILATRSLFDTAFDSTKKAREPEGVKVRGEALVDAIGKTVEEFWKVCKGRKGKGKAKDKASPEVWESFCTWLDNVEDEVEDNETLTEFILSNLTAALSLAPASPTLGLLQLEHLQRILAPSASILSHASKLTERFGVAPTPDATREQVWIARLEVVTALSPSTAAFDEAVAGIPFSGRVWDLYASWIEDSLSSEDATTWYSESLARVQKSDVVPPVYFVSTFPAPRDIIPHRFLNHLSADVSALEVNLPALLATPVSPSFLTAALSLPSLSTAARSSIHSRIVAHPQAGIPEWVAYAKELMLAGEVQQANAVVTRAKRTLGDRKDAFERVWMSTCDEL